MKKLTFQTPRYVTAVRVVTSLVLFNVFINTPYAVASQNSVSSDPIYMPESGLYISPIPGWEYKTETQGLSLIMQENQDSEGEIRFQRNMTLAVKHHPSYIDEERAVQLSDELTARFSKDIAVRDFQIIEHRLVDQNRILVFSSLKLGGIPVTQVHLLVSGEKQQALITYTDLEERFSVDSAEFDAAWQSMNSLHIEGSAPARFEDMKKYGIIGGSGLLALGFFFFFLGRLRNRRLEKDLLEADDCDDLFSLEDDKEEDFDKDEDISFDDDELCLSAF